MTIYKLGSWKRDDQDISIHPSFEEKVAKLFYAPNSENGYDLRQWASPVENQGQLSSCVANSIVGGLELLRIKEGLQHEDLSRLCLYYNARAQNYDQDKDEGSYIRLAMKTLQTLGVCKEATWKYDVANVNVRPPWMAMREAYCYRIKSFSRITTSGSERNNVIETALRSGHPVVFGMMVDDAFCANTNGRPYFNSSTFVSKGSHAMLIVGFDKATRTYIVRNSWGTAWGDNGYWYMDYDVLNICEAEDFWIIEGIV